MKTQNIRKKIPIVNVLFLGYAVVILVGSFLLLLPSASADGLGHDYIDCLLTSVSATCVTGLIPFDTALGWSLFGQIVILSLIQIGGLGFMTVVTLIYFLFGRRIGLRDQNILMQSSGGFSVGEILSLIRKMVLMTFGTEFVGAVVLSILLFPQFQWKALYYGVFTSVSAFCNAGFDVFGTGSLTAFSGNSAVLLTVAALIVIGATGFVVWSDLFSHRFRLSKCMLHTKIVLAANAILIFGGAILFYVSEFTDFSGVSAFSSLPLDQKLVNALFLAVSPRTAGFAALDLTQLGGSGQFLTVLLMFIGGNSGSTAGGVKVTTVAVVLANLVASARKSSEVKLLNKKIPEDIVKQANAVLMSYLLLVVGAVLVLGSIEDVGLNVVLFEVVSAVATVGLSLDFTPTLEPISKLLLVFLMYVGRLGAFSLFEWLFSGRKKELLSKPEGKIMVG